MAGVDVAEYAAGADRGELLIITDQAHTAATTDDELDGGVEGEGVGHPGLVDDHQRRPVDALRPAGQVTMIDGPGQFRQRFGRCTGGIAELCRSGGGRGQAEHLAAAVAPCASQGGHGGGFAGPGRSDR